MLGAYPVPVYFTGLSHLCLQESFTNSHLMEDTTPEVIVNGYEIARETGDRAGIPVEMVTAMGELAESPEVSALNTRIFKLKRIMLPPWLRSDSLVA